MAYVSHILSHLGFESLGALLVITWMLSWGPYGNQGGWQGSGGWIRQQRGKGKAWLMSEEALAELSGVELEKGTPSSAPGLPSIKQEQLLQPRPPSQPPHARLLKVKEEVSVGTGSEQGLVDAGVPLGNLPRQGTAARGVFMSDLKKWLRSNLTVVELEALPK